MFIPGVYKTLIISLSLPVGSAVAPHTMQPMRNQQLTVHHQHCPPLHIGYPHTLMRITSNNNATGFVKRILAIPARLALINLACYYLL